MSLYELIPIGAGGFVGFAVGLFSFKIKSRWCPVHGIPKDCPDCRQGLPGYGHGPASGLGRLR
jgi:hypothetical protein